MKVTDSANATLVIQALAGTKDVQELGEDESYRLDIDQLRRPAERADYARRHARTADFPAIGADHGRGLRRACGFDRRQPALSLAGIDD